MADASLFDLTGKVALITGGSRGLGREMALAFARSGAAVAIASRKQDACEAAAEEVRSLGVEASAHACHVGRWDDLAALTDAVYARFGRVDVLVNNAGMSPVAPSSLETPEALFDKVIDVNLKGPFRLSALVGSRMRDAGGGAILNVSSTASIRPEPVTAPYAAAKAGLNALTVAYAKELAPTVRVNAIMAGPFETDISKAWSPPMVEALKSTLVLDRIGRPEEVVGAALYFASDASSFTTGAVLRVDGGTR